MRIQLPFVTHPALDSQLVRHHGPHSKHREYTPIFLGSRLSVLLLWKDHSSAQLVHPTSLLLRDQHRDSLFIHHSLVSIPSRKVTNCNEAVTNHCLCTATCVRLVQILHMLSPQLAGLFLTKQCQTVQTIACIHHGALHHRISTLCARQSIGKLLRGTRLTAPHSGVIEKMVIGHHRIE